ncbi:MAG: hypothetical protein AAFX44_06910 [Pseudomonadota bacterium]
MIVPSHWAEAKERVVIDGQARTYRRFGWSNDSEADALERARERVEDAAERATRGEKVRLIDRKVPYNGAEGLPIREEVIARHGDTVITRNSYGALCLNTPDVLFADVDFTPPSYAAYGWMVFFVIVGTGVALTMSGWGVTAISIAFLVAAILAAPIGKLIGRLVSSASRDPVAVSMQRIEAFADKHPSWSLRVYRTPNGLRILAMHAVFDPVGDDALAFLRAVGSDKNYVRMCRNQRCFRARVSPKPWRIDIAHIKPRPGVWPIRPERMAERESWVDDYERKSRDYASCRYVSTVGMSHSDRRCEDVCRLHDELCRSDRDLPLA